MFKYVKARLHHSAFFHTVGAAQPRLGALLSLVFLVCVLLSGAGSLVPVGASPRPLLVTLTPGDFDMTISIDGTTRRYILHIPLDYDGRKPLPLVFVLHGFGGLGAKGMAGLTGMSDKADQENFFVAYLNGMPCVPGQDPVCQGQFAWNSGLTPILGITADDVAFVRELAKHLEKQLRVDSRRVYAAGFSNGAFMSHRLGAELSDVLAGVAVVEGTIGLRQANGKFLTIEDVTVSKQIGPIPVIMIHGKQDASVLYDGGVGGPPGHLDAKPVADAVAFWVQHDDCQGPVKKQTSDDGNVITESHGGCAANSDVVLVSIGNGEHAWPNEKKNGLSATDTIWAFFAKHARTD